MKSGFPVAYCSLNNGIISVVPILSSEYISIAIYFIVNRSLYVISISLYITFKGLSLHPGGRGKGGKAAVV